MAQKSNADLVPALLGVLKAEVALKTQAQAVACVVSFVNGLVEEDEAEIEETKKSSDILLAHSDALFSALIEGLKKAI
jgi:hypothetical protein